jgi:hypothetical protein
MLFYLFVYNQAVTNEHGGINPIACTISSFQGESKSQLNNLTKLTIQQAKKNTAIAP